ncbi:hypothetical protein EMIT0P44_640020 [Pseudomonas sp. IT-P44]
MLRAAFRRWRPNGRRVSLMVYISIAAVTATYGFSLTASHLEKPQVTKGSCPFRSVPR